MFKKTFLVVALSLLIMTTSPQSQAEAYPPELAPMVVPLEEVDAMMANGTFVDGEFSLDISNHDAATFAKTVKNKLRTAKSEYSRMPRKIRTTKEANTQWYRMDAHIKTSEGFSDALQRHARAIAEQDTAKPAPKATTNAPTQETSPVDAALAPEMTEAQIKAAERKKAADARAAAIKAQQEETRAKAAAVKAEKEAARKAKAEGVEPTGSDWQNSYIPNINELESKDGFFQWPWSAPSWQAVTEKAASEQEKNKLGSTQVAEFEAFVLEKADQWPAVPKTENAGDAQYAIDMIRKRETEDGLDVVDLWISRPDWKIQHNSLGAIISRTKPGYLLYKDPSGQDCILKQFWIKEAYIGDSNFEKTSSWRYAKIRFQTCDRR